jgi:hypothetical protein
VQASGEGVLILSSGLFNSYLANLVTPTPTPPPPPSPPPPTPEPPFTPPQEYYGGEGPQ